MKRYKTLILIGLLIPIFLACQSGNSNGRPPGNAVIVHVTANTALTSWLQTAGQDFNEAKIETAAGRPIYVVLNPVEAGQAVLDISSGADTPALWIPDAPVWADLLAERGHPAYQADCLSLAESPLVIAMWRPIAESLGWPGRSLGWLDVGSLAADPSAWAYYSGGQFGPMLRMGHTHPGLSGSGAGTLLAVVQAAESKQEAVTVADIQKPIVQASVSSFEGTVSWFSPATDRLGQTMRERGSGYLGAAVMYESTVINHSGDSLDLVPVYPFEGTFMASHPACLNSDLSPEVQEAAGRFRRYLIEPEAQQAAVANGLRPVNQTVTPSSPLDSAHGVDLAQPGLIFQQPSVETIYAVQDLWQAARKDVNMVMLLDVSGSMEGDKIEKMRAAAVQFMQQMGEDDYITLIPFSSQPRTALPRQQVTVGRAEAIAIITGLEAGGGTALYDAIRAGAQALTESNSAGTSNALVVLTDGRDTRSNSSYDQTLIDTAAANQTTVFTIAYGRGADEKLLSDLAGRANGNFYKGTEANISAIYQEMSAAFGGSAGIGR